MFDYVQARLRSVLITYSGFPAEDVTVETEPILWEIKATLKKYVLLQSTRVVWGKKQE